MTAIEETTMSPTPIYAALIEELGHPGTYARIAREEYLREHGAGQSLDVPKPKPPSNRKGRRHPKTPA